MLHKFLQGQTTAAQSGTLLQEMQGAQMEGMQDVAGVGNTAGRGAADIQNAFMGYFVNV